MIMIKSCRELIITRYQLIMEVETYRNIALIDMSTEINHEHDGLAS